MYKQAGPANILKALVEAGGKAGGKLGKLKGEFKTTHAEGTNAYDLADYLYNLPGSMFGQGIYGKWGAGSGLKWLGKQLGASGKYDVNTGKWSFAKPTEARGGLKGLADKLAELGEKGIAKGEKAVRSADAAADRIAKRYAMYGPDGSINWKNVPAHLGAKAMKHMDGVVGGGLLAGGAGLAADHAFGEDSAVSKAVGGINSALAAPFEWANPLGLALNLGSKAVGGAVDFGKNKAIDVAEAASRQTAESIAQGIQDQGRLAMLYGAMTPEGFAQKLRNQANDKITDRFRDIRQQMS